LDWALLLSQQIFQSQGNMTKVDSFIDQGASTRLWDWGAPFGGVRNGETILYPEIGTQSKDPQNKGCVTTVITTKRRDQTKVQALLSFYPHEGLPEAAVRFACQLDEVLSLVMGSPCRQFRVALTRQYLLTTADIFKIIRDACSGPTWGLPIVAILVELFFAAHPIFMTPWELLTAWETNIGNAPWIGYARNYENDRAAQKIRDADDFAALLLRRAEEARAEARAAEADKERAEATAALDKTKTEKWAAAIRAKAVRARIAMQAMALRAEASKAAQAPQAKSIGHLEAARVAAAEEARGATAAAHGETSFH
jgi:hypothetical protein